MLFNQNAEQLNVQICNQKKKKQFNFMRNQLAKIS